MCSQFRTSRAIVVVAAIFIAVLAPLPVSSTPGFLVNRILMPYLTEAVTMIEEGIPAALIDKVALEFGMPMGPVELADTVGLDISGIGDIHVPSLDTNQLEIVVGMGGSVSVGSRSPGAARRLPSRI